MVATATVKATADKFSCKRARERIRYHVDQGRNALWHYQRAGHWLCRVREHDKELGRKWLAWLRENFNDITVQQAYTYMRVSEHWTEIVEPAWHKDPDLSLRAADELIRRARPPRKPRDWCYRNIG